MAVHITRKTAQIFGSSAGVNQISKFGSLAAGSPTYSTDPAVIQALANWLTGWFGGVEAGNSPAIEDMNAFCYVMAYQVAYLLQAGVAEWDVATTYYKGQIVSDGNGNTYVSIQDTNLNHTVTTTAWWWPITTLVNSTFFAGIVAPTLAANVTYTLPVVPATSSTLQISSTGILTTVTRGISATATVGQIAKNASPFTVTGGLVTSATNISGSSCTLQTAGRPVQCLIQSSDFTTGLQWITYSSSASTASQSFILVTRDSTAIMCWSIGANASVSSLGINAGTGLSFLDLTVPAGGAYTYQVQYYNAGTNAHTTFGPANLVCFEI